jgi:hypothetical protein
LWWCQIYFEAVTPMWWSLWNYGVEKTCRCAHNINFYSIQLSENNTLNWWIWSSHGGDYEEYVFWDVMPYNLIQFHQHFRGTYCLYLHGLRVIQASRQQEEGSYHKQYVPPKRHWNSTRLHSIISKMLVLWNFEYGYQFGDISQILQIKERIVP